MKKILLCSTLVLLVNLVNAQVDTANNTPELKVTETTPTPKKKYNLSNRANDHFLLQLGYTQWLGIPDSIATRGFSRSINTYFMFDFPFKTTPQLSAAIGLGVGSDHMLFDSTYVNVKGVNRTQNGSSYSTLRFDRSPYDGVDGYFKKTKLANVYLEVPVELRYVANPEKSDRSFKVAVGGRVGTMMKAGTRNRKFQNNNVYPTDYTLKENSKRYFNTTRIVGTARVGFGHFTVFGSYQFTNLLKDGAGPEIRPITVGLSIGGL